MEFEYKYGLVASNHFIFKRICDYISFENTDSFLHEMEVMFMKLNYTNKTVLDIGCGNGLMSIYLSLKYPDVKIDAIDENKGRGAKRDILLSLDEIIIRFKLENINVIDVNYWDHDKKYDLIVARHSLHHIPHLIEPNNDILIIEDNCRQYIKLFNKLFNNLNRGGELIFSDVVRNNIFTWMPQRLAFKFRNVRWGTKPTFKEWIRFIRKYFIDVEYIYLIPRPLIFMHCIWFLGFPYIFPNIIFRCKKM